MKIEIEKLLKLSPELREDVLKLVTKIAKIRTYQNVYQECIVAEIMADIYNDPNDAKTYRSQDMKVKFEARE